MPRKCPFLCHEPRRGAPTEQLEAGLGCYRRFKIPEKSPFYAALPEPITVAPGAGSSETCDFLDMRWFVVSCGRSGITRASKVLIYPFATRKEAQKHYERLWWCWKLLADVSWEGVVLTHESEVGDDLECNRIHRLLGELCNRWFEEMTQRELDRRRGRLPPDGESAACADDIELRCFSDRSIGATTR